MSDAKEEELNLNEGGEAAADGEKGADPKKGKGFDLKALLPNILKFAAIGLAALIFIVTVAVITFNIMSTGGKPPPAITDPTNAYMGKRPIYAWYNLIGPVTTRTRDPNVTVTVEVQIGYDDLNGNAAAASNINAYQVEMRDWVRRYFSSKTAADLLPENELRLKNEIRERLNTEILDTTKARQIMFTRFDVMEL
ncbi:flagellar basal body protein FliL [Spirochaetia bacterium]|nr:flagellar basal body protein FliL [Spirochaetia bacterium]